MSDKLRVATILGTRPEIIRLTMTIKALDANFNHVLIHTGQNWDYQLNDVFFKDLDLRAPDHFLNSPGENLGQTIGNIIAGSHTLLGSLALDAVLILGDTNSSLAAISAKRLKIPIFHMEAGNRCFDENVPEEINRKIVDHISDVNLPYTEYGRRNLIREGINRDFVFVTGSPMREFLDYYAAKCNASTILSDFRLQQGQYFVLSLHREENVDEYESFSKMIDSMHILAKKYNLPIIFTCHPRTKKKLEEHKIKIDTSLIIVHPPFGIIDYIQLQKNSFCVLSDSGTLSEESALLGFYGVLLRTSTERPESLEAGTMVVGGKTTQSILQAVDIVTSVRKSERDSIHFASDYASKVVSRKVVNIIASYAPIVRRRIWHHP